MWNNLALNVPSFKVTLYAWHVHGITKNQRDFKKTRDAEIAISVFSRHARSSRGDIISSFTRYDIRLTLRNLCAYLVILIVCKLNNTVIRLLSLLRFIVFLNVLIAKKAGIKKSNYTMKLINFDQKRSAWYLLRWHRLNSDMTNIKLVFCNRN